LGCIVQTERIVVTKSVSRRIWVANVVATLPAVESNERRASRFPLERSSRAPVADNETPMTSTATATHIQTVGDRCAVSRDPRQPGLNR
jgi:hypothetical protein